jgi:CRP-like cAMP-binding protein
LPIAGRTLPERAMIAYDSDHMPMRMTPMHDDPGGSRLLPFAATARLAVASGDHVFRLDDPTRGLFQVTRGRVRLVRSALDGSEVTLHIARQGETFAEASLFAERYHCDAVADLPSTVLLFEKAATLASLAADPVQATRWIGHLSGQVQALRAQVALIGLNAARERVLAFLQTGLRAGEDGKDVVALDRPWKAIASELGLTHEALYRTLARLEREGLIRRDRHRRTVTLARIGR